MTLKPPGPPNDPDIVPSRRQPVNVLDFDVDPAGNNSSAAGILAAVTQARADGRSVYIPDGTYFADGALTPVDAVGGIHIAGAGMGRTILLHERPGNFLFGALGTIDLNIAVQSDAGNVAGTQTLKLLSTAGLTAGDLVALRDPSQIYLNHDIGLTVAIAGERARIKSVDSATQITLWGLKEFSYTPAAFMYKITAAVNYSIEDLTVRNVGAGSGGSGARAIKLDYVDRLDLRNVEFIGLDDDAIRLKFVTNFRIANCHGIDLTSEGSNTPYMITPVEGCSFGVVEGCTLTRGRHLITGGAGSNNPAPAHILVANCIGRECFPTPFDVHPGGGRKWTFANCQSIAGDSAGGPPAELGIQTSGFQIRGDDCLVRDPMTAGYDIGVQLVYGEGNRVRGGDLSACDIGVLVNGSIGASVKGVKIKNPREHALEVKNTLDLLPTLTNVELDDIDVEGNPSGAAFEFTEWDDSFEISNRGLRAPDATTKFNGAPHQAKYGALMPDVARFETVPRVRVQDGSRAPFTSGVLYLAAIDLPKGELIPEIGLIPSTAGAGITNLWYSLWDKYLDLLGVTNDNGAGAITPAASKRLTLSAPHRTTCSGLHYLGFVVVGATPFQVRGNTTDNLLGFAPKLVGTSTAGLTNPASAPATAAAITGQSIMPYAFVV